MYEIDRETKFSIRKSFVNILKIELAGNMNLACVQLFIIKFSLINVSDEVHVRIYAGILTAF